MFQKNVLQLQNVSKQKKELETELLLELSFREQIKSLQEQQNKLSKAVEALKYEKNKVPFNLYQEVHDQIYQINVEEKQLIVLERNLRQDVSDALNSDDLQFLAQLYGNQIQYIKNKFEQSKQKLERLEGQIIQVSPTFLNFNSEQQELYLLCQKLNEFLHQQVNIKKQNLFFQQHLSSSNYKTILPQMVVVQQKQYLESKKNLYLTYQQQAEENLALSIKNRTPKIQHRFNILKQQIIKHINDMGEQISCCEKGLSLINYLNNDHLEYEVKQFEQNLDNEKRALFTYQIQLNRIRIILNKQLMENPSQALSELKQQVKKYEKETQTIKQNYNFSKEWQRIFSQFQTQFQYAVQVKCNAILVKLIELKRFIRNKHPLLLKFARYTHLSKTIQSITANKSHISSQSSSVCCE